MIKSMSKIRIRIMKTQMGNSLLLIFKVQLLLDHPIKPSNRA